MDRPWTFGSNLTFGSRRGRASQAFPAQPRQTQGLQHECSSASRHSFDSCSTESHSLPPPSSAFKVSVADCCERCLGTFLRMASTSRRLSK